MPKQTKSSNTSALRGFVLTLVIIILAVCVMAAMTNGFTNWNPYGWFDDKPADEQQPDGENNAPIDATITNGEHVTLAMSAATTAAEDGYTKSVTLTATVMPEDAPDKTVDWSIAWNEAPTYGENPVTDYVTVTPQSDGSNVATVTCHKAFGTDTVIVTVTTRTGGYTASAQIVYAGLPTELIIDAGSASAVQDAGWGVQVHEVNVGTNYQFSISPDNGFHSIGADFVPNYTIEYVGVGDVYFKKISTLYGRNGNVISSTSTEHTQSINDDIISSEAYGSSVLGNPLEDIIDISLDGATIKVSPKAALSSLTYTETRTSTNWVRNASFAAADADKVPYVQITIEETNTGVTQTLNVRVISSVNGVSLSEEAIAF